MISPLAKRMQNLESSPHQTGLATHLNIRTHGAYAADAL